MLVKRKGSGEGAYSSRPGAQHVSEEEETSRLVEALSMIRKRFPDAVLSVDTFRASVSELVVNDFGVDIVNDISGGMMDEKMLSTCSFTCPFLPVTLNRLTYPPFSVVLSTVSLYLINVDII